jgi:uncharacterized protein
MSADRGTRGPLVFLLLTFALAWPLALGPLRSLPPGAPVHNVAVGLLLVIPGLCALFVRLVVERRRVRDAGLRLGPGRYWLLAWLGAAALVWLSVALSVWCGQAEWDRGLFRLSLASQLRSPGSRLPPPGVLGFAVLLVSLTLSTFGLAFVGLAQESGWRGYLLMRLRPRLGTGPALVLTGTLWGLWCAPLVQQGYLYPQHPQIAPLLMVGFCVLFGVVLGWLRLASRSVLVAALAYATFASQHAVAHSFLSRCRDAAAGLTGLVGLVVLAIVIAGLWLLGAFKQLSSGGTDAEEPVPEQV